MNECTILFFATLKDRAGTRKTSLILPDQVTVYALKNILVERFPTLKSVISHALVAINHEYAQDEELIPPAAEIALFPPVSGGSPITA